MADFQYTKIPVFAEINDAPVAPTEAKAGNGSHLIQQYNYLVDDVESEVSGNASRIASLDSKVRGTWIVINNDAYTQAGQRILFKTNSPISGKTVYNLFLPDSPEEGTTVSFINTNASIQIELKQYTGETFYKSIYYKRLYIADEYVVHTLLYAGVELGWIPTNNETYLFVGSDRYNT